VVYNNLNVFTVPQATQSKFYRTSIYIPTNAVCINNLAKLRFAQEIWSHENKIIGFLYIIPSDVAPYLVSGRKRVFFGMGVDAGLLKRA
jgi:hypothetical protein